MTTNNTNAETSIDNWHDCTGLQRDVLLSIKMHDRTAPTGKEIRSVLKEFRDETSPSVYRVLQQLDEVGVIDAEECDRDSRAKSYRLTKQARSEISRTATLFDKITGGVPQ